MEDTGWPHTPLDDYTAFWGDVYAPMLERSQLLRIEACFQTAHGGGPASGGDPVAEGASATKDCCVCSRPRPVPS